MAETSSFHDVEPHAQICVNINSKFWKAYSFTINNKVINQTMFSCSENIYSAANLDSRYYSIIRGKRLDILHKITIKTK